MLLPPNSMNKLKTVRHVYMTCMWSPLSLDTFASNSFPRLSKCHSLSNATNVHHCLYSILSRPVKMSIRLGGIIRTRSFPTYDFPSYYAGAAAATENIRIRGPRATATWASTMCRADTYPYQTPISPALRMRMWNNSNCLPSSACQ